MCLDKVFSVLLKAGLTLKLSKCKFVKPKLLYIGHIIRGGTIELNPEKVQALFSLGEPDTKKKVRSILAMFRYYSSCIPNFSEIVLPLVELTKKRQSSTFVLTEYQRSAFNNLKKALLNYVALHGPACDRDFIIHTGASNDTVAACLSQFDDNSVERPIAFISKKLSETQRRWSVIEKEAYAIVYALDHFDYFIYGMNVILYTEHNPLTYLIQCAPKSAKLTRWMLGIQRWNLLLKYKDTKSNVVSDCLTRV